MNRLLHILYDETFAERSLFLHAPEKVFYGRDLLSLCTALESHLLKENIRKPVFAIEDRFFFTGLLCVCIKLGLDIYLPAYLGEDFLGEFKNNRDYSIFTDNEISLIGNSGKSTELSPWTQPTSESRFFLFTSGSSGNSTKVEKNLKSLFAEVANIEDSFADSLQNLKYITASVSQQHIYGLIYSVIWPLLTNRAYVSHADFIPLDEDFVLISSPAYLRVYPKNEELKKHPQVIFSSGGALTHPESVAIKSFSAAEIIEVFGSTETGAIAWRFGTETLWRIFNDVSLDVSVAGNMLVQSPYLLAGVKIWESADKIELSADSRTMKYLGRADRVVKVSEKRISLNEIEALILQHPFIAKCQSLLIKSHRDEIAAAIILNSSGLLFLKKNNRAALSKLLRIFLNGKISGVAIPRRWRFLHKFPENSQGKLTEADLKQVFEDTSLPEIHALEEGEYKVCTFSIPVRTKYFTGHFVALPILPGVIQLDWLLHIIKIFALGEKNDEILAIPKVKFQQPMMPGMLLNLKLKEKRPSVFEFSYLNSSDELMSAGTVHLGQSAYE